MTVVFRNPSRYIFLSDLGQIFLLLGGSYLWAICYCAQYDELFLRRKGTHIMT